MTSGKIQPPFLKKGDEVAIISPSFCIDEVVLRGAVDVLENWGLKVRLGKNALKKDGPFAGSDADRLHDMQEMTDDPGISAVLCSRGGYGLSRIIDKINFSSLKRNPKWFSGFSDVTILHMWLNEVCGIMSIHGEMPLNFNNKDKTEEAVQSLRRALFGELNNHTWSGVFYRPANVRGEVTGGNLSLLFSLTGTKAHPVTKGRILFLEDVGEYYYNIDRMLTSMRLSGMLEGLAAMVVGGFTRMCDGKIPWGRSIEDTILGIVRDYGYPVLFGFPSGHMPDNRALYIGKQAEIRIDNSLADLRFTE